MGYHTDFTIEIKDDLGLPVDLDSIAVTFHQSFHISLYLSGGDVLRKDSEKWYSHEKDLKKISLDYPNYLFTVYGEGEDPEDLWVKYFLNGKMQSERAEISYARFDKNKLV